MAYENLCMYCFEDRDGEDICPHCGRDSRAAVPQIQMLPGTLIYNQRFLVGRALGQDASGIVYAALDTKRNNRIRLREYLPRDSAERLPDGSVVPIAGREDAFERGMRKLRASVEGVDDPAKRHFYFEENGTAYVAQRHSATAAAAEDDEEEGGGLKRVAIIVGIAAALVVGAAILLISGLNRAMDTPTETAFAPTASATASASWAPAVTPSPTPYASPTFAALVDPEQSWLDYTYAGDVESDYQSQQNASDARNRNSGVLPTLNPGVSTSDYSSVSRKSSSAEITRIQQRLTALGWLSSRSITGQYDDTTRQAVRDFQTYINEVYRPTTQLTVDGIAGPKTQQWLYGVDAAKPTPTPTVMPTEGTQTIDASAAKAQIRAVQQGLITLGLMSAGQDDGVYGNATKTAVSKFQQRVNQLQGYDVLPVNGTVDALTWTYLNYYVDWWTAMKNATASPVPVVTPTPTPALPTSAPDAEEQGQTVDRTSAKESIQAVQRMLIEVGLLRSGADDGIYGSGTVAAVAQFQEWVNERTGQPTLDVTGTADARTLSYLEYVIGNGMKTVTDAPTQMPTFQPTASPTGAPTEAPTDAPEAPEDNVTVDSSSPRESVQAVQQMLTQVGVFSGSADGVYGGVTEAAVRTFQRAVNDRLGQGTVDVTGVCDASTLGYLEEFVANGWSAAVASGSVTISINGTSGEVTEITSQTAAFTWTSNVSVEGYNVEILNSLGNVMFSYAGDAGFTRGELPAAQMIPGEVYTIRVGARLPGGQDEIIWQTAQFMVPAPPTAAPTEAPTEAPTAAPTEVPTAAPTEVPIGSVNLVLNGGPMTEIAEVGGSLSFNWYTQGAERYDVSVTDSQGNAIFSQNDWTSTGGDFPTGSLTPGEVYTISVTAKAASGMTSTAYGQFVVPIPPTPAPTAEPTTAPTEAPTEAPPAVAEITVPQIGIDGEVIQRDGLPCLTGDTAVFRWTSDGDVMGYLIYLVNSQGVRNDIGQVTDTSITVPLSAVPEGTYTIYVGAVPQNATSEADVKWNSYTFAVGGAAAAEPTAAVQQDIAWPTTPLSSASSPAEIYVVQQKLRELGLLSYDPAQDGQLDTATLRAISSFQQYMMETFDIQLDAIDPENPDAVVDATTLYSLQQADASTFR